MLPLTLVLLLVVANRAGIMGRHRNSRSANVLGGLVVLVIVGLSMVQLARVFGLAE